MIETTDMTTSARSQPPWLLVLCLQLALLVGPGASQGHLDPLGISVSISDVDKGGSLGDESESPARLGSGLPHFGITAAAHQPAYKALLAPRRGVLSLHLIRAPPGQVG